MKLANSTNWQIKKLHPAIFTGCSNKTGDYFFTFWQKFIRIVATCWQLNSTNSVLLYRSSEVCLLKPQLSSLRL